MWYGSWVPNSIVVLLMDPLCCSPNFTCKGLVTQVRELIPDFFFFFFFFWGGGVLSKEDLRDKIARIHYPIVARTTRYPQSPKLRSPKLSR